MMPYTSIYFKQKTYFQPKENFIMSPLLMTKHCQSLFTPPIIFMTDKHDKQMSKRSSIYFQLRQHTHQLFPTAKCTSHEKELLSEMDTAAGYEETELRLPGIQVKRRPLSQKKTFGELDINELIETESGWDRVKNMYRIKSGIFEDEATKALNTMLYRTVIIGFCLNALTANNRHGKVEKSISKMDAMKKGVTSQGLKSQAVIFTAMKETLKLSVLTFSLLHLSQTIAAYRNKTSIWEYTVSSAIGFGAIGITRGMAKFGIFTVGGAIIGSIGGLIVCKVLQDAGLTQEMRNMKRMEQILETKRYLVG